MDDDLWLWCSSVAMQAHLMTARPALGCHRHARLRDAEGADSRQPPSRLARSVSNGRVGAVSTVTAAGKDAFASHAQNHKAFRGVRWVSMVVLSN